MRNNYSFVALLVVGCAPAPQTLTGRVAPGFPMSITTVTITTSSMQSWKGDVVVATAPVAADGSFRIEVAPVSGLTMRLSGSGNSHVVFPRQAGTIDRHFTILPNGVSFDLGAIRYVGSASTTQFAFNTTGGTTQCDGEGHDANGATCVDDQDQNGGHCDAGDGEHDNEHSGESDEQDTADAGDDAIAEHNFPADGCADGGDNGGDPQSGDHGGDGAD